EASVAAAVGKRYTYYKAGNRDLKIRVGDSILKGSVAERTYIEGRRVEMLVEESVLGAAYYGIGYPVNFGSEAGAIVIILPPDYMVQSKKPLRYLTGKLEDTWRPVPVERV